MSRLEQLEKEEKELLKRLAEIRKEKKALQPSTDRGLIKVVNLEEYSPEELNSMSKQQLLKLCEEMSIPLRSKERTKNGAIEAIKRRYRSSSRGAAFAKMIK